MLLIKPHYGYRPIKPWNRCASVSSKEYVADRVRSALSEAKGNRAAARQLLISECARDARLVRGLVAPYLPGIVAHALGQLAESPQPGRKSELPAQALETVVGQLGKKIGEARVPRGMTALTEPPTRPVAGQRHEDAIRQLAESYKRK